MAHACNKCSVVFSTKSNLTRHVTSVHGKKKKEKKHLCPGGRLPGDKSKTKNRTERNYYGARCTASFARADHLKRHLETYHAPADFRVRFPCPRDGCEAVFTQACNLKRHVKSVHEATKDFSCHRCGKSFTRKATLDVHLEKQHP